MFPMMVRLECKRIGVLASSDFGQSSGTNKQATNERISGGGLFQDLKEGGTLMKSMIESSVCSSAAASIQRLVGAPAPLL